MFTVGPWARGGESWLKLVNLNTEADFSKDSNFLLKKIEYKNLNYFNGKKSLLLQLFSQKLLHLSHL